MSCQRNSFNSISTFIGIVIPSYICTIHFPRSALSLCFWFARSNQRSMRSLYIFRLNDPTNYNYHFTRGINFTVILNRYSLHTRIRLLTYQLPLTSMASKPSPVQVMDIVSDRGVAIYLVIIIVNPWLTISYFQYRSTLQSIPLSCTTWPLEIHYRSLPGTPCTYYISAVRNK